MRNLSVILLLIASAFTIPEDAWLETIRQQWQVHQESLPDEQVYLSVSEEVLAAGDTLWFGGYLRGEETTSKVLYVELIGGQRSLQKETYLVNKGYVSAQLSIPDSLSTGLYQLRAYTQWMRNGDENTFFHRPLLVINAYDDEPPVPEYEQIRDTRLQVQAEGGQWVRGLPARLLLSLGGENNQILQGRIIQDDSLRIADVRLEKGMDIIRLQPVAGAQYHAEVYLPSGDTLTTSFPQMEEEGVSLMADFKGDRLHISAYTRGSEKCYLLVRDQNTLLHSSLMEDTVSSLDVPLDARLSDLLEVAVLDARGQVLAQRLLYHKVSSLEPKIVLDKTTYAPREETTASISLPEGMGVARVSVSVRKWPGLSTQLGQNIGDRWSDTWNTGVAALPSGKINQWLVGAESPLPSWQKILDTKPEAPEFRKEDEYLLLSGRLSDSSGDPLQSQMTLLSVPGFNPHFDYDRTDASGRFHIPVYDVYGQKEVIFQTPVDSLEARWALEDKFAPIGQERVMDGKAPLLMQEVWDDLLSAYRLRSQIRTQYGTFINQPEKDIPRKSRFYGEPNFTVRLDDYIALPDFVEVARELMPGIRLRKEGDHYVFSVFDVRTRTFLENPPALLLDGVLIQDPDAIVSLPPSDIERIETVNRRTYYGEYRFDGMIAVYTKAGDAYLQALPTDTERREITFFTPRYPYRSEAPEADYLPDFRTLLHWKPALSLEAAQPQSINFYNRDELGTFIIVVEGITEEGFPVWGTARYSVGMEQAP